MEIEFILLYIISVLMVAIPILLVPTIILIGIIQCKKENKKMRQLYNEQIKQYINIINSEQHLNTLKKKINITTIIATIIALIITISIITYFNYFRILILLQISIIGVLIIKLIKKIHDNLLKDYKNYFKENIIKKILKEKFPTYTYNQLQEISNIDYLFKAPNIYDKYTSDNKIEGSINNHKFSLSNIKIKSYDPDSFEKYPVAYYGPVIITELTKNTNMIISILSKYKKPKREEFKINTDNKTFQNMYNIYTSDYDIIFDTISPKLTATILELYNKYEIFFEVKIVGKKISIKFYTPPLFEPMTTNSNNETLRIIYDFITINKIKEIANEILKSIENSMD